MEDNSLVQCPNCQALVQDSLLVLTRKDHPALGAEHKVKIAKPDVEIDHRHPFAARRQRCAKGSG